MGPRPGIARLSLVTAAVSLAGVCLASTPTYGYVRKRTDGGVAEYWQVSCVPVTIYTYGFTDMTRDQVATSIGAAAHTWSPTEVTCADGTSHPFLEIVTEMADEGKKPPLPAWDGQNTVIFYTPSLQPPPDNPIYNSSSIVALTSVFARANGKIVDADVQINNIVYPFTNRDPGFVPPGNGQGDYAFDLQNAVTHELGHLQGLGHTCWDPFSDLEQPIDDMNNGAPNCESPDAAAVADTVMFATISGPTEVSKRVLSADDIRAVCSIYPPTMDPNSCSTQTPNDGCGCGTAGTTPALAAVVFVAWVIGVQLARRRRRRR